jgi:RND superfamily putative drug exporter
VRRFFSAVGRFSVRFRWLVLLVWLVGTAASTHLPSLASVAKSDNTSFLPTGMPSVRAAQLATPIDVAHRTTIDVVTYRPGGLSASDSSRLLALEAALHRVPTVVAVRDLGRSPDGTAEELAVMAAIPVGADQGQKHLVGAVRQSITRVPTDGMQVHLAGNVATQVDSGGNVGKTDKNLQIFASIFVLGLLLVVFRSALAPIITLFPALLVTVVAGHLVGLAGRHGLQVSELSQFMLIILVIGAGTDYGLFLVFRVREEMRAGLPGHDAVVRAVERVGESITFSAGTVIAALLSLLIARFGIYQSLGAPLAIGIAVMLLAGLTLLPALLAIFGRAAFWPSNVSPQPLRLGLWGRVAGRVVGSPALTLAAGIVFFGGLAVASIGNKPAGFGQGVTAPAGTDANAGDALLASHFPPSASNPTLVVMRLPRSVWEQPGPAERAEALLSRRPVFSALSGPFDPTGTALSGATLDRLHSQLGPPQGLTPSPPPTSSVPLSLYQSYRATGQFVSPDGHTVLYDASLTAGDPSTTRALDEVPAVRAAVSAVARRVGASASGVTGEAPGIYDVSSLSDSDLLRVVPVAVLVIGILLALVMRSLVAPLYLVASVALSYLAALGVAVIVFVIIGNEGGLTFILPFLMFLFLLALGEDYNILVMTRIREEAHHLPLRDAITRAVGATGSTVTSAGLVLAGTFGVLTFAAGSGSGSGQVREIGTGLAIGILMDTFLVRTLVVPSAVALLGRWNWWPSRLGVEVLSSPDVPDLPSMALSAPASEPSPTGS